MVEDFELEAGMINTPLRKEDWNARQIEFIHIPAVDFLPLSSKELQEGIAVLELLLNKGSTVYIHCKAGRGRSASIVVGYLMQTTGMSLDEAIAFVKQFRPQISLNAAQRQAISNYFNKEASALKTDSTIDQAFTMTKEALAEQLTGMLDYAIEGSSYEAKNIAPELLGEWIPSTKIESTFERRDRYLKKYHGIQQLAVDAAIHNGNGIVRKITTTAIGAIPMIGSPMRYSLGVWHQLREISLIAALYGHDLRDPQVKVKILEALLAGNIMKAPAQSVDIVAKMIIETVLIEIGCGALSGSVSIPAHLIFNYFTDNSAKVSTYAKKEFQPKTDQSGKDE